LNNSFEYYAIDTHGEKIVSYFTGTKEEFYSFIQEQKLFLLSVKEKEKKLKSGKFNLKDLIFFIEELSYLVSSGMNLDKALKLISNNSEKEIEKKFILDTLKYLKEGNQLSNAMELSSNKHKVYIDNLTILLIRTNESIGKIEVGLIQAKEHLEFNEKISKSIKQAMGYPIFLIIMSITMIFFVFFFIVPKFSTIFTPSEFQKLPFLSKNILEIGMYVNTHIQEIFFLLGIVIILFFIFKQSFLDFIKYIFFKLPMFRKLQLNLQLSYFFSSLNLMLDGGIDLKTALVKSREIISYEPLKNLIDKTIEGLKRGAKISDIFYGSSLIPPSTISLISSGENSASLNQVFSSLSERFIGKFQDDVKKYISILEPVVIVFMGGVIAFIVVAIMLAVMSITDVS